MGGANPWAGAASRHRAELGSVTILFLERFVCGNLLPGRVDVMVLRTTVGLLKAGPSMNVGRDLGTVWGITFFDWINYRLLARPRCAERPGKAEHFTQAERVAVASPDGSCHNRDHTPRPCNGKAGTAAHIKITDSTGLIMVTPDRICWRTHREIAKIPLGGITDLQT